MDRDHEDPTVQDPYRRTPPLSLEGSREVLDEMARPPADTPERRALFARRRSRLPRQPARSTVLTACAGTATYAREAFR